MPKILVVDDNIDLLRLIELKLVQDGYHVALADNGTDGLEKIPEFQPDAILLDVMMPDLDGWEFCRRARETTHTPIIMLTARNGDQDIIKGLEVGADEYLTKPFPLSTLSARIDSLLRRQAWAEADAQEEISGLKMNIISALSHQLRTPIALILNALDLSLREFFKTDIEAQKRFIREARQNAETLRWLIEDLLLMVRIDEGLDVLVRPSDLGEMVRQTIQQMGSDFTDRGIQVKLITRSNIEVHVDQILFRHALHHLLVFCLNKAAERSQLALILHADSHSNIILDLHLQGPGLIEEHQHHLFDRFYHIPGQLHWKRGGIGAGLHIARAIAEAHGGHLDIVDGNENGFSFRLVVPAEIHGIPLA